MLTVRTVVMFVLGFSCGAILSPCLILFFLLKGSVKIEGTWPRDI